MPLNKSQGNMYDWVTHVHSHLGGECSHHCSYCYVQKNRFGVNPRYKGEPRLVEKELDIDYGYGKTIFIEHLQDLFSDGIKDKWIIDILNHCKKYDRNIYVFQTKNPDRAYKFLMDGHFPREYVMGTTIETNRDTSKFSKATQPPCRAIGMNLFDKERTFVTIEPIMDFDYAILLTWLLMIKPAFINIGADSKRCNLPEPSRDKIIMLVEGLEQQNIKVVIKPNLFRIIGDVK